VVNHRNPDGTFNGVAIFAELTGLSPEEIKWTFDRMKQLRDGGVSAEEMVGIVAEEVKSRPWEKQG
jgi:hypothetical protein